MSLLVPPPIVAIVCALLMWASAYFFPKFAFAFEAQILVVSVFIAFGLALDIGSVLKFFARKTTITPLDPDKTSNLVTDGFYRFSRNPMYLGMAFLLTGLALYLGNLLGLIPILLFIWYISKFQIIPEEKILADKFGQQYISYMKRVRRWL